MRFRQSMPHEVGVEFVPFAVAIAEPEGCLDDEFGVDPVALVDIV